MKTIFTIIATTLTVLNSYAGHFSAFNLRMFNNTKISVSLDNQPSCHPSAVFTAKKIQPGYHKLYVYRMVPCPYSYYPMKEELYNGWVYIPHKSAVYAQISCHNKLDIVKVEPYHCPPASGGNGWGHHNGWDNSYDNGWGYDNTGYVPMPVVPAYIGMHPQSFAMLKATIESKSFESSKLQIAKQALTGNTFSSAQVTELLMLFDFESTKLEFAKHAYHKVADKQNFYLVNNAFSFASSIDELNQYIKGA